MVDEKAYFFFFLPIMIYYLYNDNDMLFIFRK